MKKVASFKSEQHLQALAEYADWEWMLRQVVEFRQRHEHESLGDHPAGEWLRKQRQLAQMGKLSTLRRERLEKEGISLPKVERKREKLEKADELPKEAETWENLYSRLDAWQESHGHCEVPRAWAGDPELARWTQDLRRLRAQRRLTQTQETRLEALGFFRRRKSAPKTELWEHRYAELVAYQKEHGHTNVTKGQNRVLGHWRDVQREFRKKGMLSADRIARLDEIGFEWEAPGRAGLDKGAWFERRWEAMLAELAAFKECWGHCLVPVKWQENSKLGNWVATQRSIYRQGKLVAARVTRLETLGFQWEAQEQIFQPPYKSDYHPTAPFHDRWEERYAELVAFYNEYGHTNVTEKLNELLGQWRETQRTNRRLGKLQADRIAKLEEIGFEWQAPGRAGLSQQEWRQQMWEKNLRRLIAFKERFGHCHVPVKWQEELPLAHWVHGQRKRWRRGKLEPEPQARLEALGFFKPNLEEPLMLLWEQRYAELVAYRKEHGHTNVTKGQNQVLGHWRDVQREFRKKGMLSAERIARLEEIGFEWQAPGRAGLDMGAWHEHLWEMRLAELAAFKERFGHCLVPVEWKENLKLGGWVSGQRKNYCQGKLPEARVIRLEAMGFHWRNPVQISDPSMRRKRTTRASFENQWEQRYAELVAYQNEHGHTDVSKAKNRVLGRWRHAQRESYKAGTLSAERISRLEGIGFTWEA